MLILGEDDIAKALPMGDAIVANARAFRDMTSGHATVPDRVAITVPDEGATLFKPAMVGDGFGLKVVSIHPKNDERNLPTCPAVIMMIDKTTGLPTAVLGATFLTAMRTAAGSGAATHMLAKQDAAVLTVFGAGMQIKEHIRAVMCVRPGIKVVNIVNRTAQRAQELADFTRSAYKGVEVHVIASGVKDDAKAKEDDRKACAAAIDKAVSTADVICTATHTSTPLFDGKLLKPGCHINAVGSFMPHMQELDETTITRSRLVVDTVLAKEAGDLHIPIQRGTITMDHVCGELGDFVDDAFERSLQAQVSGAAAADSKGTSAESKAGDSSSGSSKSGSESKSDAAASSASSTRPSGTHKRTHSLTVRQARRSAEDITLFKSVGVAVQDIATSYAVVQAASKLGLGTSVKL